MINYSSLGGAVLCVVSNVRTRIALFREPRGVGGTIERVTILLPHRAALGKGVVDMC